MKTWRVNMLIVITITSMPTILEFIATIPSLLSTLFFATVTVSLASENSTAESAFFCFDHYQFCTICAFEG
jgi:hypothetical protein